MSTWLARLSALLLLLGLGPAAAADPGEPEPAWPFVRPLFGLSPAPSTHVRLATGYTLGPLASAVGFGLEGSLAFLERVAVRLRAPFGLGFAEREETSFSWGDLELGLTWRIFHDPASELQVSAGLELSGPTSRLGEQKDLAGVQAGRVADDSNFGKRYLLAQRPLMDLGLNPKTNLTVTPWVALGRRVGRVSLQADFGCLLLVQDRVDSAIYGVRERRVGALMFFDLAAPVALTPELALVFELNGLVGLDTLRAVGLTAAAGARYRLAGLELGLGLQAPLLVDGEGEEGDFALGRAAHAALVRQQLAVLLDLAYRFD
jgi:hypothetical protein